MAANRNQLEEMRRSTSESGRPSSSGPSGLMMRGSESRARTLRSAEANGVAARGHPSSHAAHTGMYTVVAIDPFQIDGKC